MLKADKTFGPETNCSVSNEFILQKGNLSVVFHDTQTFIYVFVPFKSLFVVLSKKSTDLFQLGKSTYKPICGPI